MRNKAQAKLSHGNYPHVSSRFEVQTSTKGQPKDQNSIFLAISTPLATRWCGYRASYSGRQSPSSTPLSLTQSCSVPATCMPRTCRERRIPLEPPKGRRLAKSASDQPSTTGHSSHSLGHNATPPKPPPLKQTPQVCSMPAPCTPGSVLGRQVPTAPPRGRRLAKTRYR